VGQEIMGALSPLSDAICEVFVPINGPQEGRADAFDDDRVCGGFRRKVASDASVGLAGQDGGEGVCAKTRDRAAGLTCDLLVTYDS
jgi:hypothetical protein